MSVSAEYIANLVAELDADKAKVVVTPDEPWCECGDMDCFWCN